jgi:F-type H+-transporting ATPase subunit b
MRVVDTYGLAKGTACVIVALILLTTSFAPAFAEGARVPLGDMPNVVPTLPDTGVQAPDVSTDHAPVPAVVDDHHLQSAPADHATTATEHTGDHGSGGLPQFDATWFPSQLFWLAVTFFLMYRFFARTALPRIADTMAARAGQIQGDITSAEQIAEQAKNIRTSYEREMMRAKDKAGEAIREVDAKIKLKSADMLYSYRTKLTMETTRAMDDLNREKVRLVSDMHALAADMTARAASQILDQSVDVDQAARVIEQIDPTRRAA